MDQTYQKGNDDKPFLTVQFEGEMIRNVGRERGRERERDEDELDAEK